MAPTGRASFVVAASVGAVEALKDQAGLCRWNYALRSMQGRVKQNLGTFSQVRKISSGVDLNEKAKKSEESLRTVILKGNKAALDVLVKSNINRLQQHKLFSTNSRSGRLEGKIALITGAASGIGRAAAIKFIANGAKVLLADVQDHLGKSIAKDLGPNAIFIHCDVTNEEEISSAVDHVVGQYGRLDVMYNNAGVAGTMAPTIIDLDLAGFDRTMAVNVRSIVAGIKHASRVMIPCQAGSIICTASTTGMLGGMAPHDYAVSKAAVIGLIKSTAAELSQHGIRVNCISPHALPTAFGANALKKLLNIDDEKIVAEITHNMWDFKGAKCDAADIADAAVYLASDDAKYISGHNLVVDGGFTSFKRLNVTPP